MIAGHKHKHVLTRVIWSTFCCLTSGNGDMISRPGVESGNPGVEPAWKQAKFGKGKGGDFSNLYVYWSWLLSLICGLLIEIIVCCD